MSAVRQTWVICLPGSGVTAEHHTHTHFPRDSLHMYVHARLQSRITKAWKRIDKPDIRHSWLRFIASLAMDGNASALTASRDKAPHFSIRVWSYLDVAVWCQKYGWQWFVLTGILGSFIHCYILYSYCTTVHLVTLFSMNSSPLIEDYRTKLTLSQLIMNLTARLDWLNKTQNFSISNDLIKA